MALALTGLVWLLLPGAVTPSLPPALAMVVAGVAWGAYTLLGRKADAPLAHTARNFVGCVPLALVLVVWAGVAGQPLSGTGIALALASGAITSAIGYAVWYAVLPALGTSLAAVLQLLVPVVAALGRSGLAERSLDPAARRGVGADPRRYRPQHSPQTSGIGNTTFRTARPSAILRQGNEVRLVAGHGVEATAPPFLLGLLDAFGP